MHRRLPLLWQVLGEQQGEDYFQAVMLSPKVRNVIARATMVPATKN